MKKENKEEKNYKFFIWLGIVFVCMLLVAFISYQFLEKSKENAIEPAIVEELPKVYFEGDIVNMESKADVRNIKLKYESKDLNFEAYTEIKIQGTSSLAYEKKNYTIKLFEDERHENKKNVDVGFGEESKYCLKANWIDRTHARNIVTARIASSMQEKYGLFLDTPNYGVIDGFPIEVYINGEFLGLYTWNIPKDAWMFNMDKDNANHIVLSGNTWSDGNSFVSLATFDDWEVEVGEESDETLKKLNRLVGFVKNSTDEIFKKDFSSYLNLDSTLNYYVMLEFAELVDNSAKNMLLVTYDGEIWSPSLYDLDTAFGTNCYGNELLDYTLINDSLASNLWKRFAKNFSEEIKERYFELRKEILTEENVLNEFRRFENSIPKEVFQKETEKWGPNLLGYDLLQIEDFLKVRIPIVDEYMNGL